MTSAVLELATVVSYVLEHQQSPIFVEGQLMAEISGVIAQLREQRSRTEDELRRLDQAIGALTSLNGVGKRVASPGSSQPPRKTLSAAARRRISLAQKARWAKRKSASPTKSQQTSSKRRVLSIAARRKIAAAARARWARV